MMRRATSGIRAAHPRDPERPFSLRGTSHTLAWRKWASSPCGTAASITATAPLTSGRRFFLLLTPTPRQASRTACLSAPASPTPPATYAVWEIRALLQAATRDATAQRPMLASDALRRLPKAAQTQLQHYVSPPPSPSSTASSVTPARASAGFLAYVRDHLSADFDVQSACLIPLRSAQAASTQPPVSAPASAASSSPNTGLGSGFRAASATVFANTLPPPPLPHTAPATSSATDGAPSPQSTDGGSTDASPRSNVAAMAALVPYLPTFYVPADRVAATLPPHLQRLYRGSTFVFYVRRFRYYVDVRIARGGVPEVRLKPGFAHPQAGVADGRFQHTGTPSSHPPSTGDASASLAAAPDEATTTSAASSSFSSKRTGRGFSQTVPEGSAFRPPPRHSEAHLISLVLPLIPKEFTPLADVLPEVSDIISHHASFNALLGVTGFFCKYPEYFQLAYARLRVRPYRSAPNALDDLDLNTSPFPAIIAKIWARCDAAAFGKNYDDPVQRKEATVSTSKLYALLTVSEKESVRTRCGSFPQFLRLHGQLLRVSSDNMRVAVFKPEYEKCADTVLDARLQYGVGVGGVLGLSESDPVVRIPERMPEGSTADNAVRELYDALPLTRCVPLDELLLLVPSHVSAALPQSPDDIVSRLEQHRDSFDVWRFPDDPSVVVVMRAQVDVPDLDHAELTRSVLALIPTQGGGTDIPSILQRAPAPLQRYLYRHGVRATLEKLNAHIAVSGDRVIRFPHA